MHIDVTHGFRHLPMLAVLSAMHLKLTKGADIQAIWYASFDPDTGEAPVYNLNGLLHIANWVEALSTYEKDGDYGVFAPLLGETYGKQLERAAFYERTNNSVKPPK